MSLSLRRKIAAGSISGGSSDDLIVISVADSTPISVAYDTAFASITKATTANVTLSDSSVVAMNVTWNIGTYDQDAAGDYDVYGDLTLPAGVINPFLAQAHVLITVQEEIFVENLTTPNGFQTYTILAGVTELTSIELIGGGASGGGVATANRAPGSGGGAFSKKNNIPVTAGDLVPYYVAPDLVPPLPSGSDIEGSIGNISYFGPSVPTGSTILSGSGAPAGGTGSDGNYYSNILTGELYGPKASGSWPGSPAAPWCRAAGGNKGTGVSPGTGGTGGQVADCIGDTKYAGGNGIAAPTSRSGAGGAGASPAGAGANATTTSGTTSVGGVGVSPGGNGGNGSSGTAGAGTEAGGGGAGARNTTVTNTRGGTGEAGWARLTYSGASVPPVSPGDAYVIEIDGQSNVISPGNGASAYPGPHNTNIWVNTTNGFDPLEYGVNQNSNSGGSLSALGPECGIASVIGALAPGETYIVKKGQSATAMYNQWNVANNAVGRASTAQLIVALQYLEAQGKTIQKIFNCFRQGCADQGVTNPWNTGTYRYGTGVPSSGLGSNGDIYVDKTNNLVYGIKGLYGTTAWGTGFTLFNLSGSGTPSSGTGSEGNTYYDTTNDLFYLKTGVSTWTLTTVIYVAVKASYLKVFYDLIKYRIDALTTAGFDLTVIEFKYIDCLIDNPQSVDSTFAQVINYAKREAMANFDTANPTYATKTVPFDYISMSDGTTVDGVHLSTASEDLMGVRFAGKMSIP